MPRLSIHPKADFQTLTVSDFFIYKDLCEGKLKGKSVEVIAAEIRVSRRKCGMVLKEVVEYLNPEKMARGENLDLKELDLTNPDGPGQAFCQLIRPIIETLANRSPSSDDHENRVVVQGSDFCVLWILPAVLHNSGYLRGEGTLEIRRGSYQRFMANLRSGRTDLAIGPKATPSKGVKAVHILTVPRMLISPKGHSFACGKPAQDVTIEDLSQEIVFYLESSAVPALCMSSYLPPPKRPGKRVAVDSISHIYQYVSIGLGVSIGYSPEFLPRDCLSQVVATELRGKDSRAIPPAEFFLYYSADHQPIGPVIRIAEAICKWASEKTSTTIQFPSSP
jgi:DNA-binding transcriptional LysR family regulator